MRVGDWGCSKVGFVALWGAGLPSTLWGWECKAWGSASPGCGTGGEQATGTAPGAEVPLSCCFKGMSLL